MLKYTLILVVLLIGCNNIQKENPTQNTDNKMTLKYLALGDSYTIGESVEVNERWPNQLSEKFREAGLQIEEPVIIATTGWTTGELIAAIAEKNISETFDMVSLLIGVNNQYRGYDFAIYEKEFPELLETAIQYAGGSTSKVFVVSIPDYGATPFGKEKEPAKIAVELDEYNAFAKEVAANRGVKYFNITDVSREAETNPELTASDQLHPSSIMYSKWVEIIHSDLLKTFKQ